MMRFEASADARAAARAMRDMYTAMINEGFSVDETMTFLAKVAGGAGGNKDSTNEDGIR